MAQWVAAQRPTDARGVAMVGGGIPLRHLGATWPVTFFVPSRGPAAIRMTLERQYE